MRFEDGRDDRRTPPNLVPTLHQRTKTKLPQPFLFHGLQQFLLSETVKDGILTEILQKGALHSFKKYEETLVLLGL